MTKINTEDSLLGPYRVLDLTEANGLLCAKLMADLGADVLKVERPGGDAARNLGPFYKDEVHPEKSLTWWAFNLNKRGITLNLETADGRDLFRRLVKTADFVVESYPPGFLDSLGLGYRDLEQINPGLILVSLTAFGQSGPYAHYKGPDIVAWAMGGVMYVCGEPDTPPVRVSFPQAWLHVCGSGLAGAMAANWHRLMTGEGQQVDVSAQHCACAAAMNVPQLWDLLRTNSTRAGSRVVFRHVQNGELVTLVQRQIFEAQDGYVQLSLGGGPTLGSSSQALVDYMAEEGAAPDSLKAIDWPKLDHATMVQEEIDAFEKPAVKFISERPAAELYEQIVERRIIAAPLSSTRDLAGNRQLAFREAWAEVEHPDLGEKITYPGEWAKIHGAPLKFRRRAPLIGEHNDEIYLGELGLSREQLAVLKGRNVI